MQQKQEGEWGFIMIRCHRDKEQFGAQPMTSNACTLVKRGKSGLRKAAKRLDVRINATRVSRPASFASAIGDAHPGYPNGYPHGTEIWDGLRLLATLDVFHVEPSGRRRGRWVLEMAAIEGGDAVERERKVGT